MKNKQASSNTPTQKNHQTATGSSYLEEGRFFHSLSVRDLLEARDAYHVFLTRKSNVIGTAIGKYRIRKPGVAATVPKRIENTEIRHYSWPCVMVFVKTWVQDSDFGKKEKPTNSDYIPKRLFLPDGREIPVCVIEAAWKPRGSNPVVSMKYPGSVVGGGFPIMTRVQGEERWATFGCLVTDGRLTYGLTNLHVAGRPGESLYTVKHGNEREIGVASEKQLQKKPFSEVYETFPGRHSFVNLDIGLLTFTDLQDVTSEIFGLGKVEGLADVNHDTLSLKLIGCPVLGYGCVSGVMKGEIIALFYRYASAGGYDYISDYLVAPRAGTTEQAQFAPTNGDSGTLLIIDDKKSLENRKAIGVLWGGQRDQSGIYEQPYALVTNIGTICRLLDVELVNDCNLGYDRYFGAYAHVVLPSLCADVVKDKKLKAIMEECASYISAPLGTTKPKATHGLSNAPFVPLGDVPDLVWKKRGGLYQRGKEGPNHFADMDQALPTNHGQTLLKLCEGDESYVDPDRWVGFYKSVGAKEKGALPFRIAQVYDEMVKAAEGRQIARFVCSAGILTHYVFDACMPLHISYMHHGDPNGPMRTVVVKGKEKDQPLAYEVHDEFDNAMVEYFTETLKSELPGLVAEKARTNLPVTVGDITSPKKAAVAAVKLMRDTVEQHLNPIAIVRDYERLVDLSKRERCDVLWEKYGKGYLEAMAEAVVLTARLWEAAWKHWPGRKPQTTNGDVTEGALRELYETKDGFLDSVNLEEIKGTMAWA